MLLGPNPESLKLACDQADLAVQNCALSRYAEQDLDGPISCHDNAIYPKALNP